MLIHGQLSEQHSERGFCYRLVEGSSRLIGSFFLIQRAPENNKVVGTRKYFRTQRAWQSGVAAPLKHQQGTAQTMSRYSVLVYVYYASRARYRCSHVPTFFSLLDDAAIVVDAFHDKCCLNLRELREKHLMESLLRPCPAFLQCSTTQSNVHRQQTNVATSATVARSKLRCSLLRCSFSIF